MSIHKYYIKYVYEITLKHHTVNIAVLMQVYALLGYWSILFSGWSPGQSG